MARSTNFQLKSNAEYDKIERPTEVEIKFNKESDTVKKIFSIPDTLESSGLQNYLPYCRDASRVPTTS